MTNVNLNLSNKSILYGYFCSRKFKGLTNLALLVAKYFIHKCFLNEKSLDFKLFKLQLHEKALTEQFIATKNNTITVFNNKWQPFISKKFISQWHSLTQSFFFHAIPYYYHCCFYLFLQFISCLDSNKCIFLSFFFFHVAWTGCISYFSICKYSKYC